LLAQMSKHPGTVDGQCLLVTPADPLSHCCLRVTFDSSGRDEFTRDGASMNRDHFAHIQSPPFRGAALVLPRQFYHPETSVDKYAHIH